MDEMNEFKRLNRYVNNLRSMMGGLNDINRIKSKILEERLDETNKKIDLLYKENKLLNERLDLHSKAIGQIYELLIGEEA